MATAKGARHTSIAKNQRKENFLMLQRNNKEKMYTEVCLVYNKTLQLNSEI